jgi:hypothetical protein
MQLPRSVRPDCDGHLNDDVNSVNAIVAKVKGWSSQIDVYSHGMLRYLIQGPVPIVPRIASRPYS